MSIESVLNMTNLGHHHKKPAKSINDHEAVAMRKFFLSAQGRAMALTGQEKSESVPTTPEYHDRWRLFAGIRMQGSSLDAKLAEGCGPHASRLLDSRSELILSPAMRQALADNWLALLTEAREPAGFLNPRVPAVLERILAARVQIRALADAIVAPCATPRGIAMARCLLCDVSGPIYDGDSSTDLALALDEIISRLHSQAE
jgi:hypothetical protein